MADPDSPFSDVDSYIALPRTDGLALSPDGTRLVVSVSTLDPKRTAYRRSLWEIPADGSGAARRITRSAKGEGGAAFTSSGDLLFVSGRPDADVDDDSDAAQLWRLPAAGGEAEPLTRLKGGVDSVAASARDADAVLVLAALLGSAASVDDDSEHRTAREEKKVTALLHETMPVRYWDHDLGPAWPHLLAVDLVDATTPRDLTPTPGQTLDGTEVAVSPDGAAALTTSAVPEQRGSRSTIVSIDVATGDSTTILDEVDVAFEHPVFSADGSRIAYFRSPRSTASSPSDTEIFTAAPDGSDARRVAADWDRWPTSLSFDADGTGLIVTADEGGRGPVFRIDLATEEVERLTDDHHAYTDVHVGRDGASLFALRSSWLVPSHPVRIDLASRAVTVLPAPAELPPVNATMSEVEASASDGTPLRAWLLTPDAAAGARPSAPDDAAGRFPLLLWIHGGPLNSWNAWSWRWNPHLMLARGYAVLLPDPALSTGYGLEFIRRGWGSWGEKPYTDLMTITDAAIERDDIDQTRVAAMGGSFGGYMANWVAGHTDRFAAIVSHAGLWALDQFIGTTDHGYYWQREMTPDAAEANSPNRAVRGIRTPMLVIHGDKDYRVPIGESLRLWADLAEHHAAPDGTSDHRLLVFPDENHWILKPQHAKLWYRTVFAFLDRHVHGKDWVRPELLG